MTAPGRLIAIPSQIVPSVRRSASTPITRAPGSRARIATATPAASPPPPTGTTTVAVCGACSAISSPIVPWPAITSGSSKGGIRVMPSSAASLRASAAASS